MTTPELLAAILAELRELDAAESKEPDFLDFNDSTKPQWPDPPQSDVQRPTVTA